MKLEDTKPLYGLSRSTHPEVLVHGVAVFATDGRSDNAATSLRLPVRSLLKPWQALAAGVLTNAPEWTLTFASHSGEDMHLKLLSEFAAKHKIEFENLVCPAIYPMTEESRWKAKLAGKTPEKLFHPCVGKHIGFLIACQRNEWSQNYDSFDHPLQKNLQELLALFIQDKVEWEKDSCGVPTAIMSVADHLKLWRCLAIEEKHEMALLLRKLWVANPLLTGGTDRLDTLLMQAAPGLILAKEGADGLLMVQSLPAAGEIQSCFIKISSGYNVAHMGLALYLTLLKEQTRLNEGFQKLCDLLERRRMSWVPKDQQLFGFI